MTDALPTPADGAAPQPDHVPATAVADDAALRLGPNQVQRGRHAVTGARMDRPAMCPVRHLGLGKLCIGGLAEIDFVQHPSTPADDPAPRARSLGGARRARRCGRSSSP